MRFRHKCDFEQHLREGAGGVSFCGDEVRNGEFEEVQGFCVKHDLTHWLAYDGSGGE